MGSLRKSRSDPGFRGAALAALVALAWAGLAAAVPTFWTVATQSDFLKGDVEDLSIDSDGRVFLGPSTSLVAETAAPFLWTVVAGTDGTLWAGTGNEGKVLKIGKDGKVATFFDATELEVHAIVPAPGNGLYVATSPDGKIYQVSADGTARTFFDPDDKYIWALALDRAGNLFAATGDKGVIYKITPDGKGTRFYKTSSTNVVSLAFSPTGDLLAGTESPGRVFRIDATGKAFVLLDSPFKEIHALRLADDGTLYAAAVSGSTSVTEDRSVQPPSADAGRAARADSVDRDHGHFCCRQRGRAAAHAGHLGRLAAKQPGRDLPHPAERPLGHLLGGRRRLAVRPAGRTWRQPARGDRPGRQDLPAHR